MFWMETYAQYDGLRKLQGNERPFVLTRAAYSGRSDMRNVTGDNSSTWITWR